MPQPKYYTKFRKFSLFNTHFMFFDTDEYLADTLFIRQRITVKFRGEYQAPDGRPRPSIPIEAYYISEGRASCEADGSNGKAKQKGPA